MTTSKNNPPPVAKSQPSQLETANAAPPPSSPTPVSATQPVSANSCATTAPTKRPAQRGHSAARHTSSRSHSHRHQQTHSHAGKAGARRRVRSQSAAKGNLLLNYARLMRLDKPIGILLLLWPTLWGLWLAAKGIPRWDLLVIFSLGVIVMRSAGCVINDYADRKIDGQVARTRQRPLATGAVSGEEAIALFAVLCLIALGLVLLTDPFTLKLSLGGLVLAFVYPFMKRHTHLPQVILGAAFAWSVPMAFAAQAGQLTPAVGLLYITVVLWTVVYDTFYAMVDRDDDIKIGVKSTAILFADQDRFITGALQILTLLALFLVGQHFSLGLYYYLSLVVVAGLFYYQQILIREREPAACFKAFLNNNWVGATIFAGIFADFAIK